MTLARGLPEIRSKAELVAEMLRDEIRRGEIPPGALLRQREIATRFQVSPTPVREALSRLEAEGYITTELHRGATVVRQERERIEENFLIRATLESLAVELAVDRLTEEDLNELEAINNAIARNSRVTKRVIELNRAFHMGIYEATDHPMLIMLLSHLWRALGGGPHVDRPLEVTVRQHMQILKALRKKDGKQAAELTRHHILSAKPVLPSEKSRYSIPVSVPNRERGSRGVHRPDSTLDKKL